MTTFIILSVFSVFSLVTGKPIVLKGSSTSGDTVIAISSSDPNIEKYLTFNLPNQDMEPTPTFFNYNPANIFRKSFSSSGTSVGTGRNFVPTFNPFFMPFFNLPINFEGLGLSNFGTPNWMKSFESFDQPNFSGNGEVKTVTAVNDNGHVYGKVKTVTFDNAKTKQ